MHYILKSNFARIFRFLELTLQDETFVYINLHNFFLRLTRTLFSLAILNSARRPEELVAF